MFAETERLESPNSSRFKAKLKCGGKEAQIALQLLAQPPAVQSQLMVVNGPSYRFMNDDSYEILFPTKDPTQADVWIVFPYTKPGVLMLPMNGTKFMNALPGIGPDTQMEAPR